MVLTAEEMELAQGSVDWRIRRGLQTRRSTTNFSEQCSSDREIQSKLNRKGSPPYRFNCYVVHNPWRFSQISALNDHGWDDYYNPTDPDLRVLWRTLPLYRFTYASMDCLQSGDQGEQVNKVNNLNKDQQLSTRPTNYYVYDSVESDTGCFSSFFSCIFSWMNFEV